MRDRDATAILRETLELLDRSRQQLEPARVRLRTWKADGFPPGNSGGRSAEPHADPTLRAIQRLEMRDEQGRFIGWREPDPIGRGLTAIDNRLHAIRAIARELDRELTAVMAIPDSLGEEGCAICNATRLPADHTCDCPTHLEDGCRRCDDRCKCPCAARDHRHRVSHQPIHNRTAPRHPFDPETETLPSLARCQFHYDFAGRYGVDAHRTITLWHLDHPGQRIPLAMIRDQHPAQYRARNEALGAHA